MTREDAILHMTLRREELKHSVGDLDEDIKAFDMAIKALEQTRWIPVSERLPKAFQPILVTSEAFHWANEPVTYSVKQTNFGGIVDFIAWMPLPPSYEPQESEDKE